MMMMASSPAACCSSTATTPHPPRPLLPSSSSSCRPPPPPAAAALSPRYASVVVGRGRHQRGHSISTPSALPDPQSALALLAIAGTVGVAATLLLRPSSSSESEQQQQAVEPSQEQRQEEEDEEECPECGGTGLCGRCKGEGFVFKQLSEETATKARKAAKNMATRYTAGLPTKWTYCNKCSSTRSCTTCRGSGTIKAAAATVASASTSTSTTK